MVGKGAPDQLLTPPKRSSPDAPPRDALLEEEIGRTPDPRERKFRPLMRGLRLNQYGKKARHWRKNKVVWDGKTNLTSLTWLSFEWHLHIHEVENLIMT